MKKRGQLPTGVTMVIVLITLLILFWFVLEIPKTAKPFFSFFGIGEAEANEIEPITPSLAEPTLDEDTTEADTTEEDESVELAKVTLAWDPNPDPTIIGFKMYYGTESRIYMGKGAKEGDSPINIPLSEIDKSNPTYTISLPPGTWYFSVTAYNNDHESGYSNEITHHLK